MSDTRVGQVDRRPPAKAQILEGAAPRPCRTGTAILAGIWPQSFLMGHSLPTDWSALITVVRDFESP